MPDCERIEHCRYFTEQLQDLEAVQEVWKRRFCRTDNSKCARHMVLRTLGKEHVPSYLVPTQVEEAQRIIDQAKS